MIENRFLHFQTKQAFENISDSVSQNSIVFIDKDSSDNPLIWTHGKYYYCSSSGGGGAVTSVNNKTGDVVLNAGDVSAYAILNGATKDDIVVFGSNGTLADGGKKIANLQDKLENCPAYENRGNGTSIPVISTNNLGQVIGIDVTPINISNKVDKVPTATEDNLAAFTNNGNIKDSGISINYIQSLQSQINDLRTQLLGVEITATPRTNVIVGKGATIDLSVRTTDTMSGITVFRVLYPDNPATRQQTQIYTSSTAGTTWTYTDTYTDVDAPEEVGNTLAYMVIAASDNVEKSTMAYVEVIEDRIVSLEWTGGSISPATVEAGGTATLTKGTVTATYLSGETSDVTNSATFSATGWTIAGTTCTAPGTSGTYAIKASYGGVTSSQTLSVTVTSARANVQFGVGTTYANAVWTTVGPLTNNLEVNGISNQAGEYLFVKYDSRDTVNNLWINADIPSQIGLDTAITDGNYKYRRTSNYLLASRAPINYIINKV